MSKILLDALEDDLNFILANSLDVHIVEQKAKKALKALSEYASAPKEGLRWVEASERLPDKRHNYFVKMLSPTNSIINNYIWNATCLFDGEKFVDDINSSLLECGNTVVEWLDESSAPESGQNVGFKWVNASYRLPKLPDELPPDTTDERGVLFINRTHSCATFWYPSYGQPPESGLSLHVEGWSLEQWEWVDESNSVDEISVPIKKLLAIRDELIKGDYDEAYHILYSIASPNFDKIEPWKELEKSSLSAPESGGEELTIDDYKEVMEGHKRLVRELDVIINGENGARQASFCDLVSQMKKDFVPNKSTPLTFSNSIEQGKENNYVCGFLFDEKINSVVLIWKEKPAWQKGKLNGVGGKIENGETPIESMRREFKEETGLDKSNWVNLISLSGEDWICHFFCAADDKNDFEYAETMEQEEVAKIDIEELYKYDHIQNLSWLVPMAAYKLKFPQEFKDFVPNKSNSDVTPVASHTSTSSNSIEQGWISVDDKKPFVKENEDNSENVLAICNGKLMVMAYCYIDCDEDSGWAWCNCRGDIYGDPEFDDEYEVTHWRPLPAPPNSEQEDKRSIATEAEQGDDAGHKKLFKESEKLYRVATDAQREEIERLKGLIEQLHYEKTVLEFLIDNYHPSQADTKALEAWQQFAKENGLKGEGV